MTVVDGGAVTCDISSVHYWSRTALIQ